MTQELNGFEEKEVKNVSGRKIKLIQVVITKTDHTDKIAVTDFNLNYIVRNGEKNIHDNDNIILDLYRNINQVDKAQVEIGKCVTIPGDCTLFLKLTPKDDSVKSIQNKTFVIYEVL